MKTLRLAVMTALVILTWSAVASAQDNINYPIGGLCVGSTIVPNTVNTPVIVNPGNGAATAKIGPGGEIIITGQRPGATTIVVERTTWDEMHRPVRRTITYNVTVIDCTKLGDQDGGTGDGGTGTGGDTGGTGGGKDSTGVINEGGLRGRIHDVAPFNVDSFFDIVYRIDQIQPGQPVLIGANDGKIDCDKLSVSRGTVATGGMIIHGSAGSVTPGAKVTVTDGKGHSVSTTAGSDGSFTIKESELPDGFDHTLGNSLTVTVGKAVCNVVITFDGTSGGTPVGDNNAHIDCDKICALRGTVATGGMIIHGAAGSVPAGSKVTITDSKGHSVTTTAGDDGSFTVKESELPDGFDHTVGGTLTITVGDAKCSVVIQRDRIGGARTDAPGIG